MLATMIPSAVIAADDTQKLTITPTDGVTALTDGTDYTYTGGKLSILTDIPVTIGMKSGATETAETVYINASNCSPVITFEDVNINTTGRNAVEIKGVQIRLHLIFRVKARLLPQMQALRPTKRRRNSQAKTAVRLILRTVSTESPRLRIQTQIIRSKSAEI